jgi:hypothetical protein
MISSISSACGPDRPWRFEGLQFGGNALTGPAPSITSATALRPRHLAHILAEIADGGAAIDRHLPLVRLLLARDHAEQRGLACAIGTDKADLLAPVARAQMPR